MEAPQRKYMLTLELGADDTRAIRAAFEAIMFRLISNPPTPEHPIVSTSGGYDSGYHYEIRINPDMDHDTFVAQLNEYLEWMDAQLKSTHDIQMD